jgi:hypothetical protein
VTRRGGADEGARGLRGGLRQAQWRFALLHHRLGVAAELGEEEARLELSSVVQGSLTPVRQCAGGEGDRRPKRKKGKDVVRGDFFLLARNRGEPRGKG